MTGTIPARCTGGLFPPHTHVRVTVLALSDASADVVTAANPNRLLTVSRGVLVLDAPVAVAA